MVDDKAAYDEVFNLRSYVAHICGGLCSLPKHHHILCEPLNNLCTEGRAKISIFPFYRKKKEETLKFKCIEEDLPKIKGLVRDQSVTDAVWNPGLLVQYFFHYIWRGMGVESVSSFFFFSN